MLGEASRLDAQATLAVDRRNKQRGDRTFAASAAAAAADTEVSRGEPEPELVAIVVDIEPELDTALDGDVNSIVDALHRKERRETAAVETVEVEAPSVPWFDADLPGDRGPVVRPLRLLAPTAGDRRRRHPRDAFER